MSKLKNLIQALMEAFISFKRTFIAQQSLPNDVYSTSSVQASETESWSVSPCDGWASLQSDSNTTGTFVLYNGRVNSTLSFTNGGWAKQYIPVRKGDSVAYRVTSTGATLYFIRSIGGGYKRFIFNALQRFGGGLCLSYLATFERSLSSLARKHCRAVRALICRSQPQVSGVKLLQPRLMAMLRRSFSTQKQSNSQTSQQKLEQKSRQTYRQELIYPFAKVISLMCTSITQIQLMPFLNSLKPSALLSLCKEVCHG